MQKLKADWLSFDLDGTLVDSVPDITFSLNQMLNRMGLPAVNEVLARNWIGNGAELLIKRALHHVLASSPSQVSQEQAREYFFDAYQENIAAKTVVYPGCMDLLEHIAEKSIPMACVTNKPRKFTQSLLERLSITGYFNVLVCGDDLPTKKPDPAMILKAIEDMNSTPRDGYLVGDSHTDMAAARAAGAGAIYVSYGYNRGVCVEKYSPIRVNSLNELIDLI